MSLIGGTFVCLPRYDPRQALAIIETEKYNLYLVPTLYHESGSTTRTSKRPILQRTKARLCRCADDRWAAEEAEIDIQPDLSSITTAAPKSTPSRSIRTRSQSRVRPAKPGSTSSSGGQSCCTFGVGPWRSTGQEGESSRCWRRRIIRGLLEASRCRRQVAARGLVFHR